jgi:lysophosphatidic acid phosphatase type 6
MRLSRTAISFLAASSYCGGVRMISSSSVVLGGVTNVFDGKADATQRALLAEAATATGPTTYNAGSNEYVKVPEGYDLDRVVVVHRHGDRSQISRTLGPNNPESDEVASFWKTKLPNDKTKRRMARSFQSSIHVTEAAEAAAVNIDGSSTAAAPTTTNSAAPIYSVRDRHLYSGEDKDAYPYAQLTELGAQQLINIGSLLRNRYLSEHGEYQLFSTESRDNFVDHVYLRSTNMCRTLQSLRSLVVGLFDIQDNEHDEYGILVSSKSDGTASAGDHKNEKHLQVETRYRIEETMFPQGGCHALAQRRALVMPDTLYYDKFDYYNEVHNRLKENLGFYNATDKISWLAVKEVLSCYKVHSHPYPSSLTYEDEEIATEISGWSWGTLFGDKTLNRYASGRFLRELLNDLNNKNNDKKLLIYSGHDSTLVPLLCALDLYDDQWPPYASYLVIEFFTKKSDGKKYARTLYNDEVRNMFGGTAQLVPYDKDSLEEDIEEISNVHSINTKTSFVEELMKRSISDEDYEIACQEPAESEQDIDASALRAEIKATTS